MLKALVILVMIFLTGWLWSFVPWGMDNSSLTTLLAATVLIVLASFLVVAWIDVESRVVHGGHLSVVKALLGNLILLVVFVLLRRFSASGSMELTLAVSTLMLSLASLLGVVMARGVKHPSELVPVCVVAAWADLCSLAGGPTRVMVGQISEYYSTGQQGAAPLVDDLLIKTAVAGHRLPVPLFGIADWIIVAFLSAAFIRLNLWPGPQLPRFLSRPDLAVSFKSLHVAPFGLWLALVVAHLSGRFIPGLVPICVIALVWVLVRYPQSRRLSRRELLLTGLFPLLMTLGMTML